MSWEYIYNLLGITDFIYFISSPIIQEVLLPIKIVFILFTIFFFVAVIYFYTNSSYIQAHFLQDTMEFISWQPYGLRQINKRWQQITDMIGVGNESEYKLAIIEADDLLYKTLEDNGYVGESFEELLDSAQKKILPGLEDILSAHEIRNAIVYDTDYKLSIEMAKKILADYEKAIKNL